MDPNNFCASFKSEALQDMTGHTLFRVIYTQKDGKEIIKTISLEDYLSLLGSSVKEELQYSYIPEGFYPAGYIGGSFADTKNYTAVWKVEARKRTINHTRAGRKMIPFPSLVFGLRVDRGYAQGRVFALKNGNKLYQYPFGNVSTSGSICMGNISSCTEEGPQIFEDDFFAGVTNDDYFSPGSHVSLKCSQVDLISKLVDKEKFPDKWLIGSSGNISTVEELVKAYTVK